MGRLWRFSAATLKAAGYVARLTCFMHLINEKVIETTHCIGPSMLPTFNMTGDVVLVEHITQRFRELTAGDVIVCRSPASPGRFVLKRVLGVSGDNICIDPTLPERKYYDVPTGHVWVVGDNLLNSNDSRTYGPVPLGIVRGRAVARLWPDPTLIQNNFTLIDA